MLNVVKHGINMHFFHFMCDILHTLLNFCFIICTAFRCCIDCICFHGFVMFCIRKLPMCN